MNYTIGEFAALGRVSVRMLRHYDAIGLLPPAHVDAHSGHRRYALDQLPALLRIVELRDLGVGLEPIAAVLGAADPDLELERVLVQRHIEIEASLDADHARLDRIERRLRRLKGETMPGITYTSLPAVTVYAVHGIAPSAGPEHVGPVVGPLIEGLDQALEAAGRPLIEPGIFWYEPDEDGRLRVHVSYVAEDDPVPGPGYDVVRLPAASEAATLTHHGVLTQIGESWSRLMDQIVSDGYRVVGPTREVYLVAEGHEPGPDWVTELQAPVARVTDS
jgi:DNA-binding transcriptional MerR regulator